MIIADPIHGDLRTAINIKKAVERVDKLQSLGYCPTKVQHFRNKFHPNYEGDSEGGETEESRGYKSRDITNQVCKYPVYCVMLHPDFYRPSLIGLRRCIKT